MVRDGASGGFAVFAERRAGEGLAPVALGTGIEPAHPGRRLVRINGSPAAAASLGDWLAILWLTPAMDRLFVETAGNRRRFLDRSEQHTSELQSLMRISYAVFCLKKKISKYNTTTHGRI